MVGSGNGQRSRKWEEMDVRDDMVGRPPPLDGLDGGNHDTETHGGQ